MKYIIQCGPIYFWGEDNKWTTNRNDAKVFDEKGPDWGLPFAPDETDYSDPMFEPKYVSYD